MSKIFEQLLEARGVRGDFLCPKYEETVNPYLLPDMRKAVERLKKAREQGEKVLIYGDYDVDGVTASAVMREALRLMGIAEVEVMLPNRFKDGYGMSKKVVQRAQELGCGLVVTVDCGSRNGEVIRELAAAGVETVVTDHHECGEALPEAVAVVNPKRADLAKEAEELRNLAGVGVAFKVAQALVKEGLIPEGQEKWMLDLVLLGTMCDSMLLTGENRRLCYYGMIVLGKTRRPGLKALLEKTGVKALTGEVVSFILGPRLNAAGRIDTPEKAFELLTAEKRLVAAKLVEELEECNKVRKQVQGTAVGEIRKRGLTEDPVIVVEGAWHEGVLGIIAGRLVEDYRRPAFVLTEVDGVLKGSGRSFGEFNLAEALKACSDTLIGGGGHAEACGLKMEVRKFDEFRERVNEYYKGLGLKDQERFLELKEDIAVEDLSAVSLELITELKKLEPYGPGNEEPVFLVPEVRVVEAMRLGQEGQHLKIRVWDQNEHGLTAIKFFAPEEYLRVRGGETVNLWVKLRENEFRGTRSVEAEIVKMAVV